MSGAGVTDRAAAAKVLGEGVGEALARAGRGKAPVKLTVFTAGEPGERAMQALAADPTFKSERRAPGVHVVEALGKHVDALLESAKDIRRIDAGARVHGARVESADATASVVFQAPRPLPAERRRELEKLGAKVEAEREDGDIEARVPGRAVAALALLPWVGPVEVRSA